MSIPGNLGVAAASSSSEEGEGWRKNIREDFKPVLLIQQGADMPTIR